MLDGKEGSVGFEILHLMESIIILKINELFYGSTKLYAQYGQDEQSYPVPTPTQPPNQVDMYISP